METLYAIIIISFGIIIYILIHMVRKMAKLKKQNDRIYEDKICKDKTTFPIEVTTAKGEKFNILYDDIHKIEHTYPIRLEEDEITSNLNAWIDIRDLGMSARLFRCLNAAEIKCLEQVSQYSKKECLRFRNFGKKCLTELDNLMNEHNLKFKDNG